MDLLINLLSREISLSKLILVLIKNPSLLRPWIPVVKMTSPGLHAFLRNSILPWIPKAVIDMAFWFPFEQSPPRIIPPYLFKALLIPLYNSSTQTHSVLGGNIRLIVIPIAVSYTHLTLPTT